MFCSRCGSALISEAKFCHLCGFTKEVVDEDLLSGIKQEKCTRKRPSGSTATAKSALSFDEYRQQKEKERSSRFQPKAKKAKTECNDKKPSEVTIQIGLIKLRDDDLKVVRGSTLPLKVPPSIGADELRKKACEKMIKFNQDLACGTHGFSLLYPDRTEVMNLPGSGERFTLKRYKEELGKIYGRITLYLCKSADVLSSLQLSYYSNESDTTEFPELEQVQCVYIYFSHQ